MYKSHGDGAVMPNAMEAMLVVSLVALVALVHSGILNLEMLLPVYNGGVWTSW